MYGMKPIIRQFVGQLHTEYENGVMKAVQSVGFDVDKDRLLQALTDARAFYEEGYRAAMRQSKWISVKERLPENNQQALCVMTDGSFCVFTWNYIDWMWNDGDEWYREEDVTHWMPLPEPPKEG